MELFDEGLHQIWLIGDNDVLHVALHCCQRPVEGAGDEQPAVHQGKLVMHVNRAHVASCTDPCGAEGRQARGWRIFFNAVDIPCYVVLGCAQRILMRMWIC